jgi:hypothetical protein
MPQSKREDFPLTLFILLFLEESSASKRLIESIYFNKKTFGYSFHLRFHLVLFLPSSRYSNEDSFDDATEPE